MVEVCLDPAALGVGIGGTGLEKHKKFCKGRTRRVEIPSGGDPVKAIRIPSGRELDGFRGLLR